MQARLWVVSQPGSSANPPASSRPAALDPSQTLDNLGLIAIFLIANQLAGLRWAIAGASLWGARSMIMRKRRGSPIGKFLPILLLYLVVRGGLGIIFDSEDVYFGIGIATKVAIGLVLLGSVLIGKPLMNRLVPLVFPFDDEVKEHRIYHSTMSHLTLLGAAFELFSSVWDVWLLTNASVTGFVLIRFLVGTVLGIVVFMGAFFYAQRRLDKIPGFEGLLKMLERMSTL